MRLYLDALSRAFAETSRELAPGAVADAREHLESALADGVSGVQAVRDYGTPQEIAACYERLAARPGTLNHPYIRMDG